MGSSVFWDFTQSILVVTDVSGQAIGPIFKGQAFFLECCTIDDGKDRLSRNVGNHPCTLRNIPEERRFERKSICVSYSEFPVFSRTTEFLE